MYITKDFLLIIMLFISILIIRFVSCNKNTEIGKLSIILHNYENSLSDVCDNALSPYLQQLQNLLNVSEGSSPLEFLQNVETANWAGKCSQASQIINNMYSIYESPICQMAANTPNNLNISNSKIRWGK